MTWSNIFWRVGILWRIQRRRWSVVVRFRLHRRRRRPIHSLRGPIRPAGTPLPKAIESRTGVLPARPGAPIRVPDGASILPRNYYLQYDHDAYLRERRRMMEEAETAHYIRLSELRKAKLAYIEEQYGKIEKSSEFSLA